MKKYISITLIIVAATIAYAFASYSNNLKTMSIFDFFKPNNNNKPVDDYYTIAWAEVYKLEKANKIGDAYKKVKEILNYAKKENNYAQIIKTFIFSLDYQNKIVDDGFYPELKQMEAELPNFPITDQAVMHSVLGEIYLNYLKIEYYSIRKRTDVDTKDGELSTYSTKQILRTARQHFLLSINNHEQLFNQKIEQYKDILQSITQEKLNNNPTLYDFLAKRALDEFFETDITRYEVFDDDFDLNNPQLLSSTEKFQSLNFDSTTYQNSAEYQAFCIYKTLEQLHNNDTDKNLLVNNILNRLKKYYNKSNSEDIGEIYLNTLTKLEKQYSNNLKISDNVKWEKALYHYNNKNYVEARSIAQTIINNNVSKQVDNAKKLIKNIELPYLDATTNTYVPSGKQLIFNTLHSNIDKIYFRIGKVSKEFFNNPKYNRQNYAEAFKKAMSQTIDYSFDVEKKSDFTSSKTDITLPNLEIGYYAILISDQKDFNQGETFYKMVQVTDLATVTAQYPGTTIIKVLNRTTGKPIKDANVKAIGEDYKNGHWTDVTYAEVLSDKNGNATFVRENIKNKNYGLQFSVTNNKDYLDKRRLTFQSHETIERKKFAKIFTDRAIYRPGQTVYFKGVCYSAEGNNVEILANTDVYISVLDVNNQTIYNKQLTTNNFGSISGSFQIANSVVLGNYRFQVTHFNTWQSFSVEEYKRPTFEIFTNNIENEISLNQDVTFTGNAKTYSGVNVENAQVKYEIVRTPSFCGWRSFFYPLNEKSIANGTVKTDENGNFAITFNAKPDKSLPEDLGLVFTYTAKIEVTSPDGETQTKNKYLSVGYAGIFLSNPLSENTYYKGRKKFEKINIAANNAAGSKIDCNVKVIIKKLKNFDKPLKNNELNNLDDEQIIKTLTTQSNKDIDLSFIENLDDGNYSIRLETKDAKQHDINTESRFTLISEKCKNTNFNKYFWFDNAKYTCKPGETAKFIFGTSQKDVVLWYEIFQGEKSLTGEKCINLSQNSQIIEYPITENNRGGISIRYFFVKDNQYFANTSGVSVPFDNKQLSITYQSFRDKLQPGDKETIRLKILDNKNQPVNAELLASLYDESLDAIRPNYWNISLYNSNKYCQYFSTSAFETANVQYLSKNSEQSYYYRNNTIVLDWFGHKITYFGRPIMYSSRLGGVGVLESSVMMSKAYESAEYEEVTDSVNAPELEESSNDDANNNAQADVNTSDDFNNVKIRENFNETAFFEPHLVTDTEGNVLIEFTIPESLTKWHFNALAHTEDLKIGFSENHLITQKTFMVEPNLPRFFMEGDQITIPTKISNLTDQNLQGKVKIEILDAQTEKPVNDYKIDKEIKEFTVEAGHTTTAEFSITIPKRPEPVVIKIVGISGQNSDGSQKYVPVLTTRTLITQSQSFNIRANQTKNFSVEALNNQSKTQDNQAFTFEFTSNPAWLAFMSLPSLRETTTENIYSIMAAFYANSVARKIIVSNPGFENTYNQLSEEDLKSALEKNQELKSILLNETPWLLDAKNESDQMHKLAHLFNKKAVDKVNTEYIKKLKDAQYSDGGFPWIKGMKQSRFITQEVLADMGRLIYLDAIENQQDKQDIDKMAKIAIKYIDNKLEKDYKELKQHLTKKELEDYQPRYYDLQYFYARSFFTNQKVPQSTQEAYNFFMNKIKKYWTNYSMYGCAVIATSFKRLGINDIPQKIIESFKNNAQNSEEFGMYYSKNLNGYSWYSSPIETQAAIIESFATFKMPHEVEELKIWLIKNKQTNSWPSSRATVDAVYALLMNGEKLNTEEKPCTITIGDKVLDEVASKGAAYIKKAYPKTEISTKLANIKVVNPNNHIVYGASYIQYFEEYENVRSTANGLTLKKELYLISKNSLGEESGTLITPKTQLHPGDKIRARFVITTDRDLEYVFLKDNHSAAFEPINKLSGMRFQDGLWYYESTKDAAEEFFIEFMQRGTYVFEYQLYVVHKGILSNGIATIECMYSPEFRANSTSQKVKIE